MDASIILGLYNPKIMYGYGCVKYFGGVHAPKQLPDMDASIIMGVYTPKIIDGHGCVNYVGGLHPKTN